MPLKMRRFKSRMESTYMPHRGEGVNPTAIFLAFWIVVIFVVIIVFSHVDSNTPNQTPVTSAVETYSGVVNDVADASSLGYVRISHLGVRHG